MGWSRLSDCVGRPPGRPREQRGSAVVEFTWLGVLLLVPLIWIVISVFQVQRNAYGLSAAARAGARAYSLAPTDAEGRAGALAAVDQAMTDQGLPPGSARVNITCSQQPCHSAGAVVTLRLHVSVALPWMPSVLGRPPSFALDATQSAPMGRFREFG